MSVAFLTLSIGFITSRQSEKLCRAHISYVLQEIVLLFCPWAVVAPDKNFFPAEKEEKGKRGGGKEAETGSHACHQVRNACHLPAALQNTQHFSFAKIDNTNFPPYFCECTVTNETMLAPFSMPVGT